MIEVVGVSKSFGEFVAVDDVNLHVEAGEFLTLLGPSGCGKTTLLRMISGFETPTRGRIRIGGEDVTDLPPYRRDVNQVFQSYALFPHLSVRDNIAFGLRSRKTPRNELARRVAQGIELVGLNGMEHRKPQQLSGGQRQRVALARALVCEPKVLLLDEPLAALDAKLRRELQLELKRLQQRVGITFVFVTHDQDEAMVMSDRIAVVNRGRIEQIGPAGELYRRPATRFVADFLGQANLLAVTVIQRQQDVTLWKVSETITLAAASAPDFGCPVLACVRPEKIMLLAHGQAGPGEFAAKIVERVFHGATTHFTVATPDGLALAAMIANQSSWAPPPQPGDEVWCRIDPSDVVLLDAG